MDEVLCLDKVLAELAVLTGERYGWKSDRVNILFFKLRWESQQRLREGESRRAVWRNIQLRKKWMTGGGMGFGEGK